jgi:hypothetical protein
VFARSLLGLLIDDLLNISTRVESTQQHTDSFITLRSHSCAFSAPSYSLMSDNVATTEVITAPAVFREYKE